MAASSEGDGVVAELRGAGSAAAVCGALALALALQGCATPGDSTEVHTDKEYRTGSNIPVRDRTSHSDAKSYDPDSVREAVQRAMPARPIGVTGN